jgi:hypothetical protein
MLVTNHDELRWVMLGNSHLYSRLLGTRHNLVGFAWRVRGAMVRLFT